MRVLQALAGAPHGGAEMYFVRLVAALARAGVEQHAVIRPNEAREQALAAAGVAVARAPFGGPLDFRTRRVLRREIAAFEPDILLTYMSRATVRCPRGDFVHIARLGGYYDLKYYQRCDHLVGVTPHVADHCRAGGWPAERTHFIINFVDDRAPAAAHDRALLATPADAPLIFALGRLHENKGFDILLAAMARLDGAYLWLAGEGPLAGALKRRVAALEIADRVRFLGWQDDPIPYLAAADILALPSRHEPLGNVMLEGWMASRPVVATASQGPRFLIKEGETGLLVPIDDAPALAAALSRLIADRDLAARIGANGRAAFEADYTEARVVARYMALFKKVLN